jgi:hypothetical protein
MKLGCFVARADILSIDRMRILDVGEDILTSIRRCRDCEDRSN